MIRFRALRPCTLLAGLLLAGVAGCSSIQELPKEERKSEELAGNEYALCRELLMAFLENDGKKFVSLLPEASKKNFTVQTFDKTRKAVVDSMGTPISFQYVTALELTTFTPHIWKIRFQRIDPLTQQLFTSEALFRIIVGHLDQQVVVTGFQFL